MNGVLTGLGVVTYDPDTIWGPRIAYAPVEDLLFGFAMVTLTLATWAAVNRRRHTARRRGLDTRTRPSRTRLSARSGSVRIPLDRSVEARDESREPGAGRGEA